MSLLIIVAALGLAQEKAEKAEKQEKQDSTSAVAAPPMMNAPDFQRMLVQLSSDSSGWKAWTQAINARQAALDEKGISAIDARKGRLSGFLDLVADQTRILAQKESIEGDNRLLMGLQSASEASGELRTLLGSAKSASNKGAPQQTGRWTEQLAQIQEQALGHAANLLAHTVDVSVLARNAAQARRKEYFDLVKSLAWPAILAVALVVFRKPVARLFEGLGRRITKLSILDVEFELAPLASKPPWSDPGIFEASSLFGGAVTTTTVMELFARIHADTAWTYMIVDIGHGRKWLLSRLFLFTAILRQMGFLQCVVFVETRRGLSRRFLGTATPEHVYAVLSKKYQWLAGALKRSYFAPSDANLSLSLQQPSPNPESIKTALQSAVPLNDRLPKEAAEKVVNAFMADGDIRWNLAGDPPLSEWEKINETMNVWEHTKWLNLDRFNGDLREALDDPRASWMVDSPDISKEKRTRGLLRRDVRYVALVNERMEFLELFDREPLVKHFLAKQGESEDGAD